MQGDDSESGFCKQAMMMMAKGWTVEMVLPSVISSLMAPASHVGLTRYEPYDSRSLGECK
ncbi:MAG: hypothetical protein Q9228_002755 [Teloschistes exilis]